MLFCFKKLTKLFVVFLICVKTLVAQNIFIENRGQLDDKVIAKVNLPGGSLFIQEGELCYSFYSQKKLDSIHNLLTQSRNIQAHAYSVEFINSNTNIKTFLIDSSNYYENYFLGSKEKWSTNVKTFKTLRQENIYKGIDILFYRYNDNLKYDILVKSGANINNVKLKYEGLESMSIDNGDLLLQTSVNLINEVKPYAYQIIDNDTIMVECFYKLQKNIVTFELPNGYNLAYDLIIDPVLEFSTYSGSTSDNFGYTATYDNEGFLYSGSTSFGIGYPTTLGAYQVNYANQLGGTDVAITKYDTTGTQRIYSTYLGGALDELPHSMIVNTKDELFVFGTTASSDFPTTIGSIQTNFNGGVAFTPSGIGVGFPNGSDIFVSKLSASGGGLLASTFIGGSNNDGLNLSSQLKYNYADEVRGEIDIDINNNVYLATSTKSNDFPITRGVQSVLKGDQDGCILKLDDQLTTIVWSSFLGGSKDDAIYSLALDNNNNIYVTGGTVSNNFPTSASSYLAYYQDSTSADGFVTLIKQNGTQILASTFIGTDQYDQSYFVETSKSGEVYLFGQTESSGGQFIYNSNYFVPKGNQFVSVLNSSLTNLLRSTLIGTGKGTPDISPTAFLVDVCNRIYISGWGSSIGGGALSTLNLITTPFSFQETTDGNDFYLMILGDLLDSVLYATYYGGSISNEHVDGGTSRFDKRGTIYQSVCAGCGGNSDFPIKPVNGAVASTNNSSNCNNGVFKFSFNYPLLIADFTAPVINCNDTVIFENKSSYINQTSFYWDFGDGTNSSDINPTHVFSYPGFYNVTLIISNINSCNTSDTISKTIYIKSDSTQYLNDILKCQGDLAQIGITPTQSSNISYNWTPNSFLSSTNSPNPYTNTNSPITYQLVVSDGNCFDTLFQNIEVSDLSIYTEDTFFCNEPIILSVDYSPEQANVFWSYQSSLDSFNFDTSLFQVTRPGVYYVKALDGSCEILDSITVSPPNITIDLVTHDICLGDSVFVNLITFPSEEYLTFEWSNNNTTSNFTDYPTSSLWYKVKAVDSLGCFVLDSSYVNVFDVPNLDSVFVSDSTVFQGQELAIEVFSSFSIYWYDFDDSNYVQQFTPTSSGCFVFTLFNNSCFLKDSVCVDVKTTYCNEDRIVIPNAFSPNNDNTNDLYYVLDKDGIVEKFKIEIFNRFGQKVFATNKINHSWNGAFNGTALPPQVFDYYVTIHCVDGSEFFKKGNITLVK